MPLDEKKLKKASKLEIDVSKVESNEQLDELISAKEALIEQEKQEKKILAANQKAANEFSKKVSLVLQNTKGEEVDQSEYFFPEYSKETGELVNTNTAPVYFHKFCGYPVNREELIEVFDSIFDPKDGFLFYKSSTQELYFVIVPLRLAVTVSKKNESLPGDFQKHALSFVRDGSVNIDSLKLKLRQVANHSDILKK